MSSTQLKIFVFSITFGLMLAATSPSLGQAQDVEAENSTRQIIPKPSDFLAFAQELAQIAETQSDDCDAMIAALKTSIAKHQPILDRIDYASENADDETVRATYEAAQALGLNAAKCYEAPELAELLENLTKR